MSKKFVEEKMAIGVTVLIILAVPTIFQIVKLSIDQKNRHDEIINRLNKIEEALKRS
jgi:hypothetical protein